MKNFRFFFAFALLFIALGSLSVFAQQESAKIFNTSKVRIEITPYNRNIFKITVLPKGTDTIELPESKIVTLKPEETEINFKHTREFYEIFSPTTRILINRITGQIQFYDSNGDLLLSEKEGIDNNSDIKTVTFLNPGGNYYGAGERGHSLRLNGDTLIMYNRQNYGYTEGDSRISQMNITVPYVVSDHGFGILFDDYNKSELILGDTIKYISDTPQPLSYYFINGDGSLAETTSEFNKLTGLQPLPPIWALGYITSKYGYKSQDETLNVVNRLKNAGYPLDGIVLDLYWYGVETDMGKLQWDSINWPDPKKMLSELKDEGVNLIAISQPYINKLGAIDNYNYLVDRKMLTLDSVGNNHDVTIWVGESGMFDVSNPETRQWLWNRYKKLTENGIEGWWGDLGEPEMHPSTIRHHNGLKAEQYHNLYGNEWSRLIYEGLRKDFPERRPILLMRGGTAGLQRYSVFPWSTDVSRTWGGLQPQVKIMLNSGLSGLGYMSSDIGGFAVDPNLPDDPELYVRWIQLGTFSPMLRTHAQQTPEPFNFPSVENISKKFIRQRYEWLPYNYTLAYENAAHGLPLVRPLNFHKENSDSIFSDITDEYLWGDDVLIAPVMKKGERERSVIFPQGEWINWNNPKLRYSGGETAIVKAPLDELPMFIKAGAFIPQFTAPIENTTQYDPANLTILYYPSDKLSFFTLFDDNRISPTSLEDNKYQLTTFWGKTSEKKISISLKSNGGDYEGMPASRNFTFKVIDIPFKPKSIKTSDKKTIKNWKYDSSKHELTFSFPWHYENVTITIKN